MTEGETNHGGDPTGQLRSIVERAVRLETEKRDLSADLKELYAEAKSKGYDTAAIKVIVKQDMEDADKREKREQREDLVDLYRARLGDFGATPLGEAIARGEVEIELADKPKRRGRRSVQQKIDDQRRERGEPVSSDRAVVATDEPDTAFAAEAAQQAQVWPDDQQVANAEREAETTTSEAIPEPV